MDDLRNLLVGVTEFRYAPLDAFEMREQPDGTGGNALVFTGYASVVEKPYTITDYLGEYQETISRDAFDATLARGADVNFLVNHEGISMARTKSGTLKLSADETGLHAEARLNPNRPDVQILRAAVGDGDIDEMSFAFRVSQQQWNEDYTDRRIDEVNLNHGDVSAVNYGANPHTAGTVAARGLALLEKELRAGAPLSAANTATLKHILSLFSTADTAVDEGQVVLSDLLGVPNPDTAQDASTPTATATKSDGRTLDWYKARALVLRARQRAA